MKNKKVFVLIIALVVVISIIGTSYAYLKAEEVSTNGPSMTLANFGVVLLTDIESITLENAYPVEDSEGLTNSPTSFQIKNNGSIVANYKVSLIDSDDGITSMKNTDIRYQLKKTSSVTSQTETLDITNLTSEGLLDEGTLEIGETITYEMILWIDYDANPNGQTFSKVLLVEGMQSSNLDTSGANYPELLDNMIPVYYDQTSDTEGVWRKADSKNLNQSYQWFDYNNYMWANAVTVKESGTQTRETYLNAAVGTEINMEDITTMWVWIPRYKYTIWSGNNGTSEEQLINVTFEHGIDKTGTVTCVDNILTVDDSASSETCTDTTNGSIVNNKSTYTHPAFTFGSEELTGFWMAKFEMSTDDTTCLNSKSEANCNKADLNILVKPSVDSLSYQTVSTKFAIIRRMESYGNIHGFTQNSSATTYLDSNSYLTGEIANDDNNLDIHMQKNMEWGAVAYLSQSKYGKYGNSLYTDDYKRIYKNNYYTSTNYVYKTGYSGGNYNSEASTTATYLYNDMTITAEGQGYRGAGASTTGTIYGVYDMNGGTYENVMGNMVNTSGAFYPSVAGTWSTATTGNIPNAKYYDKYSYNSSESSVASQTRGKLGDATRETTTTFGLETGGWGGVYRLMPYGSCSWFVRSGGAHLSTKFGIMYLFYLTGNTSDSHSSRPVLSISREFPWLSK